jgi:hypothetical protein
MKIILCFLRGAINQTKIRYDSSGGDIAILPFSYPYAFFLNHLNQIGYHVHITILKGSRRSAEGCE